MSRLKLAVPALIVLLAAAAGGYQVWSQHQARAELDATLANLPAGAHGHYDTMSFNAFTQTLRVEGLAIMRDGQPSLTIQEVVLHHLAGSGTRADPFQASSLRLVDAELWRGKRSLNVALVQGETVGVLAPGVPPPPGTPRWLAAPGSGTLISAGAITATGIADDEGATLAAFSVADYDDGQIRQASARGFADRRGNRIATVAASALDLDGLDAVFDTGRYGPGTPRWPAPRRLIGRADITGFQSEGDDGSASVDSVTLDGFAARPFAAPPSAAYVKSRAFLADAAAAVSIGAASVSGLRYGDRQTKLSGMLSALSVSGYADGMLAQASLDGLALAGSGASRAAIGHFELAGLDTTKLVHQAPGLSTESLIEAAGNGGVFLSRVALAKLSVTSPAGHTVTLDSMDESTTDGTPTRFTARLRRLSIPARSNPELAQDLGAIGIDTLVLDLDEAGTYDIARGAAALEPLVLTLRGLASLSLSAQFSNIPHDMPRGVAALASLGGVGIGPFTLRFTNDTLVERLIAMQARRTNKTPDEIEDEAKLGASFAAAALVPQQADAGEQVSAFIADPHSLTMTGMPAAPVRLDAFLGAGRVAAQSALNLRLSAN